LPANTRIAVTCCVRAGKPAGGLAVLAVGTLLLGVAVLAAPAQTGRIVGRVRLVSVSASRPLAIAYSSRWLPAKGQPPREINNVVVYLQGMPAAAMPARHYELRQEGELFLPHVLPIGRGSWVDFTNDDPFYHNVFSLSRAGTFDLGRYPRGQARSRQFSAPGLVKVYCHLHSDMSAVIMVLDHPWFTTPEPDGGFVLGNVPAGHRTVTAWHERIGEAKTDVSVPPGGTATVEFILPVVEP
jgi:plastocyanin